MYPAWLKQGIFLLILLMISVRSDAFELRGTIFGGTNPLPDSTVKLIDNATQTELSIYITDSAGAYTFSLGGGSYRMEITPPPVSGYEDSIIQNIVVDGGNITQNVSLLLSSGQAGNAPSTPFTVWDPTSNFLYQETITEIGGDVLDNLILSFTTKVDGKDSDGDKLLDLEELAFYKTDPLLSDTDGDGTSDYDEVEDGTDPLDNESFSLDDIWVNFNFVGPSTGSKIAPFPLIMDGVSIVNPQGTIHLAPGISSEIGTISKPMILLAEGGTTRIGD